MLITTSICTDWREILYWRAVRRPKWRRQPAVSTHISFQGESRMARSNGGKAKAFFRTTPSGAFDQYLQDIQKLPLIKDPAEERRLARRVQRGDEKAAERLVTANLRFVISYVKKYQGHGLDLSELVAIGNEGLLKAVKKFDPDQGVKFISYAVWWVRQAVLKALAEQTRSVRIPLNQNSQLIRMSRTETYLSQELGREPTDNEIAQALEDSVENVRTARRAGRSHRQGRRDARRALRRPGRRRDRRAHRRQADARIHRSDLPQVSHAARAQDSLSLLRARRGQRGDDAGEDRRADGSHARAHPADSRTGI